MSRWVPSGVIAAAATPLRNDHTIDLPNLIAHCARLLKTGCDGINLLGTTGEATSFSVDQRLAAMKAIAESGLPLDRFLVGTGTAALADTVRLTSAARDCGFAAALLLPPFYYKGIDHAGLVAYVEAVIAGAGAQKLRLYLYHYPQLAGVPYAIDTVEQLHRAHPEQVLGLKDSSGDLEYSTALAARLPSFAVFPSSESTLGRAREFGFRGCISATVNINAPLAGRAWHDAGSATGAAALAAATGIREALAKAPLVAAVKWALAEMSHDPAWRRLMPPLRPLTLAEETTLRQALQGTTFGNGSA
jgi:4-hydroxy-tetrahydrodipicolinate synthase